MRIYKEYRTKRANKLKNIADEDRISEKIIETMPQDQTNTQDNKQDMDQNQKVDLKPAQFVSVTVNNQAETYTGKIRGYVHIETNEDLYQSIKMLLYFGNHTTYPIYQTILGNNLDFIIEELPPGFYMIELYNEDKLLKRIPNIKVLSNQTIHQAIIID